MEGGQRALVVYSSQTPLPCVETSSQQTGVPDEEEDECVYRPIPLPAANLGMGQPLQGALLAPKPLNEKSPCPAVEEHHQDGHFRAFISDEVVGNEISSPYGKVVTANGVIASATEGDEEEKKREREHKKRSKNWTRPETLKLIRLRTELEPRFARSGRKTELWDEIAEALQKEMISRDAQQCRDKWEKLTAGYKEVRDGLKDREDNPFYDELHPLLSGKSLKRAATVAGAGEGTFLEYSSKEMDVAVAPRNHDKGMGAVKDEDDEEMETKTPPKKRRRIPKYIAVTDLAAVQSLLETVISKQQRFFRDLLETMERKEQIREQIRQEREEKWRAEERVHRGAFNNAMIVLTQRLVGERMGASSGGLVPVAPGSPDMGAQGPKKRSKNWKRTEVLQLIKLRGDMEGKFAKSTRRAALWDELAELLMAQGIKRDGKQCREKWDKLMAEYKDVTDGKREQGESHYFAELTAIVGRPSDAG